MTQTIKKTASGYEFTVPGDSEKSLRLREGMQYEFDIIDNVVIFKLKSRSERLKELIDGITDDNMHDELLDSPAMGEEKI